MNIQVKNRYGVEVVITNADDDCITVDAEKRTYSFKKEDGKTDWSRCEKDGDESILDEFSCALNDLIYYREKGYDSSDVILTLFEKLPEQQKQEVLNKLNS
jgi:hypothetical protein